MATARQKDACDFLDADHKAVKKLFSEYGELAKARRGSKSSTEKKRVLAEKICVELLVHTQLEDEILYPAVRKAIKEELMMEEAGVEHSSAKDMITQIQDMRPGDTLYDARIIVLGEYIDHHVKEERKEMFPKARASKLDLVKMREVLQGRKEELMTDVEATAD